MTSLTILIERARPIFWEAARLGRTLTYRELAGRVGPPLNRRQIPRQLLTPLSALCRDHRLPDHSALVVHKESGEPGGGWSSPDASVEPGVDWAEALVSCWNHPWPARPPAALLAAAGGSRPEIEPEALTGRIHS